MGPSHSDPHLNPKKNQFCLGRHRRKGTERTQLKEGGLHNHLTNRSHQLRENQWIPFIGSDLPELFAHPLNLEIE